VLLLPEGLGGGELRIEAYPGLGGGRFLSRPRRSTLDPAPRRVLWGRDLDGDGTPDLAAITREGLAVYRGEARGTRVVDRRSWASMPLTDFESEKTTVEVSVGTEGASAGEPSPETSPETEDWDWGRATLEATDLDGDGRPEVLWLDPSFRGRGVMRVVTLAPGAPGQP
jgi:hypothetical protein